MDNEMIEGWEDDAYQAFVEKFKAKKTTDDCYTPANVYDAVADWVASEYGIDRAHFVRPFYPGGDYERFKYPEGCAAVDNPPFSILSKIIKYYSQHSIRFFLFAPALTLFSAATATDSTVAFIPCGATIIYENGADVRTSFVTNLEPDELRVRTAPRLYRAVTAANEVNRKKPLKEKPRYEYPDHIITAAMVQRWCHYGVEYRLSKADSCSINALDAQRASGKSGIFGHGFLLSSSAAEERAAAEKEAVERAAAEKAAVTVWDLSEREKEIVCLIDRKKKLS
ncbi:MAG: hypothetical protein IJV41_07085 [Oscillospiraceae bacterium]|nr:hypothetical protein [Oscillospiraceae bacterium]